MDATTHPDRTPLRTAGRQAEVRPHHPAIEAVSVDGTCLLRIEGDLDIASAGGLIAAARERVAAGGRHVVLDCGHLRFCDSGGLNAFMAILQMPGVESVAVVRPSTALRRLLAVTGLDLLLEPAPAPVTGPFHPATR